MEEATGGRSASTGTIPAIIAVAASAGGQEALIDLMAGLPAEFPAAIVVIQHLAPGHNSFLANILDRSGPLPVRPARDGELLQRGSVVVAPPDQHVTIPGCRIHLDQSPLVNFVRPSADVLFASVAAVAGPRAIAVVLSGTGHDGADGVRAVKEAGGTVVVQDQATSRHFGMPSAAIASAPVDYVLPLDEIAPTLVDLVVKASAITENR